MASPSDADELLALQLALQSDPDEAFAVPPELAEIESTASPRPQREGDRPAVAGNDGGIVAASPRASERNNTVNHSDQAQIQADFALATALNRSEESEAEVFAPPSSLDDGQPDSSTAHDPPTYSEAVNLPPLPQPPHDSGPLAVPRAQADIDNVLAQTLDYDDDDMFDMTNGTFSPKGRGELAIFKRYNSQGIKTRPTTRKLLSQFKRPIQALTQRSGDLRLENEAKGASDEAQIGPRFLRRFTSRASLLKSVPSPDLPGKKQSDSLLLTLLNEDMLYEIVSHLYFPDAFGLAFTCRTLSQHMAPWLPGIKKVYIANLAMINARLAKKYRVAFCSVCCYLLDEESLLSDGRDIDAATGLRRCAQCRDLVRGKEKLRAREAGQLDEDDDEEYSLLPVWRTSTRRWEDGLWYRDTVLGGERSPLTEPYVADF